ncbi:TPA: DUF3296 domain-containing protein [Enterobacter ludwigii]
MNNPLSFSAADRTAVGVNLRAFLQQAVDHYPRLAAFSFTLELPCREALNDYRSLIMCFHTEVWQRTGAYSHQRQQTRRHSPPTILRWLWEGMSAPGCNMILLMNLNTLETVREPSLIDSALQEMNAAISDAWQTVAGVNNKVTKMSSIIISRTEKGTFTEPFSQLQAKVDNMVSPVSMARTGLIFP